MNKPLFVKEYIGDTGAKYIFEYYECDSYDHLQQNKIKQCYSVAFHKDKFLVVNNVKKPGSYTLIGGSVEPGEHPDVTLVREILEESNMKVLKFKPIGYQKVVDTTGIEEPYYQLRYFSIVEPHGPFVCDPAEKVTEIIECDKDNYKQYFDWGEIGDRIIEKALEIKKQI